MSGRIRVVIPTTQGPSTVLRVTAEDSDLRSVVCLGRGSTVLPVSRAYDAFVRSPSGVVERAVGHPAFRVDVSAPIDDGESWQLGLYLAHLLKAAGRLAEDEEPAEAVIWATGTIDGDLKVHGVARLPEKLRQSADLLQSTGRQLVVAVAAGQPDVPPELPGDGRLLVVDTVAVALRQLGLEKAAPGRGLRGLPGWAMGAVAGVVLCIAAFALLWAAGTLGIDRPWMPRTVPDVPAALPDGVSEPELERARHLLTRSLDPVYPLVFFDAVPVAVWEGGRVRNIDAQFALAITVDGHKEILGLWLSDTADRAFWAEVMQALRSRGTNDLLIVMSDGNPALADALGTTFPDAEVQPGIVRLIRESEALMTWKDRRAAAPDLRAVYRAESAGAAAAALEALEARWGQSYPILVPRWRADWERIVQVVGLPPELRDLATSTSVLDELNRALRDVAEERRAFADRREAVNLLMVGADGAGVDGRRTNGWTSVLTDLAMRFGERFPLPVP